MLLRDLPRDFDTVEQRFYKWHRKKAHSDIWTIASTLSQAHKRTGIPSPSGKPPSPGCKTDASHLTPGSP